MNCPKCGKQVHAQARFCPACGYEFSFSPDSDREVKADDVQLSAPTMQLDDVADSARANNVAHEGVSARTPREELVAKKRKPSVVVVLAGVAVLAIAYMAMTGGIPMLQGGNDNGSVPVIENEGENEDESAVEPSAVDTSELEANIEIARQLLETEDHGAAANQKLRDAVEEAEGYLEDDQDRTNEWLITAASTGLELEIEEFNNAGV